MSKDNNVQSKKTSIILGVLIAISVISSVAFVTTYYSFAVLQSQYDKSEEDRIKAQERLKVQTSQAKEAKMITDRLEREKDQVEADLIEEKEDHQTTKDELQKVSAELKEEQSKVQTLSVTIETLDKSRQITLPLESPEESALEPIPNGTETISDESEEPQDVVEKIQEEQKKIDDPIQQLLAKIEQLKAQLNQCPADSVKFSIDFLLNTTIASIERKPNLELATLSYNDAVNAFRNSCR